MREDELGRVIGFAAWQISYATLDICACPCALELHAEKALFGWADDRFRGAGRGTWLPLPYWTEAYDHDQKRLAMLDRRGYMATERSSYLVVRRSLARPVRESAPPEGFSIRTLAQCR